MITSGVGGAVAAALVVATMAVPQAGGVPGLPADVETGWQAYVTATEAFRARTGTPSRFLVLDVLGDGSERRAILAGDVVVRSVDTPPMGHGAPLQGAAVHHWRGAVFLPGTTVERLVRSLEQRPPAQEDVLRASILSRGPGACTCICA